MSVFFLKFKIKKKGIEKKKLKLQRESKFFSNLSLTGIGVVVRD